MEIQATMWMAQLVSGEKIRGGQSTLFSGDVSISTVPADQVKVFTIGHNTFAHTYYAPLNMWYVNGKPWMDRPETVIYHMQDTTIISVSTIGGELILSEVQGGVSGEEEHNIVDQ